MKKMFSINIILSLTILIFCNFVLGLSGISFAAEEVKTTQSKITSMHPSEKYIGINLDSESIKIHTDEATKIIRGDKEIKFSDLSAGDKVEISYVKKGGFLGLGDDYLAKTIKARIVETQGTGKVLFAEPETQSISIEIDDTQHLFEVTKDTTLKGVNSLDGIKKNDMVFVDYEIGEHGGKTLILLEKK